MKKIIDRLRALLRLRAVRYASLVPTIAIAIIAAAIVATVTVDLGPRVQALAEREGSKRFDRPVMITHWPADIKAFYMKRAPGDPTKVLGVDVIAPDGYGEIIGGSQREDDLALLEQRIAHEQLPREAFEWYLDLRRFGSVPHGGFGLGLERTLAWICGVEHLRECIPFPRMLYRIYP